MTWRSPRPLSIIPSCSDGASRVCKGSRPHATEALRSGASINNLNVNCYTSNMPSSTTKEVISHEKGNDEAWICICGNTPVSQGF